MNWKRVIALTLTAGLLTVSLALAQVDTESTMSRAKQLYRNRDFRGAISQLTQVLELEPERAEALYLVGYAHLMLREYPASVEAFSRAFAADPTFDPRTIYRRRAAEPMD